MKWMGDGTNELKFDNDCDVRDRAGPFGYPCIERLPKVFGAEEVLEIPKRRLGQFGQKPQCAASVGCQRGNVGSNRHENMQMHTYNYIHTYNESFQKMLVGKA